jgi:hypothetical protein
MSYTCHTHVIYMSYTHVIYTCHIHMLSYASGRVRMQYRYSRAACKGWENFFEFKLLDPNRVLFDRICSKRSNFCNIDITSMCLIKACEMQHVVLRIPTPTYVYLRAHHAYLGGARGLGLVSFALICICIVRVSFNMWAAQCRREQLFLRSNCVVQHMYLNLAI